MTHFDATESLTPFRQEDGYGAILFDRTHLRQVDAGWFQPEKWGERATPVGSGGRGGAWFIDAPSSQCVLRHYLRGGMAARFSRDRYLWRGPNRTRSFMEFRLLRKLVAMHLPVPRPVAAQYVHHGFGYRAAILMERLHGVTALADLAATQADQAPWEACGRLIARFHRAGLDHADLNAHNILFDEHGKGWLIDLDRGQIRIPATGWREANLARLERSLLKLKGERSADGVRACFEHLRAAYDKAWARGY